MREDQLLMLRPPNGLVRGNLVYDNFLGNLEHAPIRGIVRGGEVYDLILGPGPRFPAPIGRIDGNRFYETVIGEHCN